MPILPKNRVTVTKMATTVTRKHRALKNRYNFHQLEQLWTSNGGDKSLAPVMAGIALAESGGNPQAKHTNSNGTIDQGLWQINSSNIGLYRGKNVYNPNVNVHAAIQLANHGNGLKNWTTYQTGAYLKHIPKNQRKWAWLGVTFNPNNPKTKSPGGKSGALDGVVSAVEHPIRSVQQGTNAVTGAVTHAILSPVEKGLAWFGKEVGFALLIMGGGGLILLGLLLIGADLGLSAFASVQRGRTFQHGQRFMKIPAQRKAAQTQSARATELHGHRVRLQEAKVKTEQARATELRTRTRHRAAMAKQSKAATERSQREAYYKGAADASSPTMAKIRKQREGRKAA